MNPPREGRTLARPMSLMLPLLAAWTFCTGAVANTTARLSTPQSQTELVVHAPDGVAPGKALWAGWRITHAEHWHSYWKNAGESGLPTELRWTLPPGITAGEIAWPAPKRLALGTAAAPIIDYGYEGTVLLPVPLTVTPAFKALPGQADIEIELHASWLICRTTCIPEEGHYTLRVPLRASMAAHGTEFEAAWQAQPKPLKALKQSAIRFKDGQLQLTVAGLPEHWRGKALEAFPEMAEIIHASAPWTQSWGSDGKSDVWTAEIPLFAQRSASPKALAFVLEQGLEARRVELPVQGSWPMPTPVTVAVAPTLATTPAPATSPALVTTLALALLGGLILNLMPCVLPVLAIKVLGFARHAKDKRSHRISGLFYTAGVLLSFLALGLLLLALRSTGESLGWGFQLQSPGTVATLAALFTVIALNLMGVFEFGNMLPSRLASLEARHPAIDALLTGVLAVIVASPCTAPFMGAALGAAFTLPAAQALSIFMALGLGLALPYLLASFIPAFAKALPKPGAWMLTLRRVLAFPMLLTVVWLVWVLGQQSSVDGAAVLLVLLVLLAALVWVLTLKGAWRWVLLTLLIIKTLWFGATFGPLMLKALPATSTANAEERWQPWSPEREQTLIAQGRAVFVDYTAAWCVTCQVNKRTTLDSAEVLQAFAAKNVALLQADWTRRDDRISAALKALGRSGVPVYVLHRPEQPPLVLSELLTPGEVQNALNSL
jgi:thiol:disulfide interchange protein DsbD